MRASERGLPAFALRFTVFRQCRGATIPAGPRLPAGIVAYHAQIPAGRRGPAGTVAYPPRLRLY